MPSRMAPTSPSPVSPRLCALFVLFSTEGHLISNGTPIVNLYYMMDNKINNMCFVRVHILTFCTFALARRTHTLRPYAKNSIYLTARCGQNCSSCYCYILYLFIRTHVAWRHMNSLHPDARTQHTLAHASDLDVKTNMYAMHAVRTDNWI